MKNSITIGIAAVLLLALAVAGVYAYGGFGRGSGMMGVGSGNVSGDYTPGLYHDRMAQVLGNGTYQDLVSLRQETGMPMMPWVDDAATFQQAQERYAAGAQGSAQGTGGQGFGAGRGFGSGFGGRGAGHGCPMRSGYGS